MSITVKVYGAHDETSSTHDSLVMDKTNDQEFAGITGDPVNFLKSVKGETEVTKKGVRRVSLQIRVAYKQTLADGNAVTKYHTKVISDYFEDLGGLQTRTDPDNYLAANEAAKQAQAIALAVIYGKYDPMFASGPIARFDINNPVVRASNGLPPLVDGVTYGK